MWVCVTSELPPTMFRVTQNTESIAGLGIASIARRLDNSTMIRLQATAGLIPIPAAR